MIFSIQSPVMHLIVEEGLRGQSSPSNVKLTHRLLAVILYGLAWAVGAVVAVVIGGILKDITILEEEIDMVEGVLMVDKNPCKEVEYIFLKAC